MSPAHQSDPRQEGRRANTCTRKEKVFDALGSGSQDKDLGCRWFVWEVTPGSGGEGAGRVTQRGRSHYTAVSLQPRPRATGAAVHRDL